MSYKGKVKRGEKWYKLYRDDDGVLLDVIKKDPNKMVDVNAYLESVKGKETKSKGKK